MVLKQPLSNIAINLILELVHILDLNDDDYTEKKWISALVLIQLNQAKMLQRRGKFVLPIQSFFRWQ